jgi:hypothetical protein
MVVAIVVAILLLVMILAGIGAYIVVHGSNREKEKEEISKIAMSGKYAAAMCSAADLLAEKKPNKTEIEEWLTAHCHNEKQKNELIVNWQNAINETIKIINDGDLNGVTTYRIEFGPKDKKACQFLHIDHFITREQINRNAELLPPYYFGSDSKVVPKLPWDNKDGTSWKSVVPKDGQYEVPNWRQIN